MPNELKTPEAGGEQKIDYNKFREYERKAQKYEETKAALSSLNEKYNQLVGKVETLSAPSRSNARSNDEVIQEAMSLISEGSQDGGDINKYTLGLRTLIEGRVGAEKQDIINLVERRLSELKFDNKYGRAINGDEKIKKKYEDTVGLLGDSATPQLKEKIAEILLGEKAASGAGAFERMGSYASGNSVDGFDTDDEFAKLRSDPNIRKAAQIGVKKGDFKDENEFYKFRTELSKEMGDSIDE